MILVDVAPCAHMLYYIASMLKEHTHGFRIPLLISEILAANISKYAATRLATVVMMVCII